MRLYRPNARSVALICAVAALTSACSFDVRRELGLVGQGPDETAVVLNDRLQMPSAMPQTTDDLPTPQPGAPSLVEPNPQQRASQVLTGQAAGGSTAPASAGETALLRSLGAQNADPSIRDQIAADEVAKSEDARLLDGLFGSDPQAGTPLDADEEAKRLAELARQGKNPGLETPTEPASE